MQRRLIKCVNTKAETVEEVDQAQCDHQPQPESIQKCNLQECESAPSGESVTTQQKHRRSLNAPVSVLHNIDIVFGWTVLFRFPQFSLKSRTNRIKYKLSILL